YFRLPRCGATKRPHRADASPQMLISRSCSSVNPPVRGDRDQFALFPSMPGDKTLEFLANIKVLSPRMLEAGEIGDWGDRPRNRIATRSSVPNRTVPVHLALAPRAHL